MKKSLLALAVLAFAGTASAQSSVTIYGKVDMALGKPIGTKDKQVRDGGGSRIGFRGQEDLGGGMFAIFGFEHRFNPDTGTQTETTAAPVGTFWNGYSWVGIRAGFGQLTLGRHYTAAFTDIQNQIDPFGGDTIAALRESGIRPGGIAKTRVSDSVRYDITAAGVKFAASVGESTQTAATGGVGPDRPWSVAANYSAGPLFIGAGYEDPQGANDKLVTVGARYGFGPVTLRLGYSDGKNNVGTGQKVRGFLAGATIKAGPGDVLVGYAASKNRTLSTDLSKKWGVGYRYPLSKRTFLYADIARDSVPVSNKGGYDLGIQHNF